MKSPLCKSYWNGWHCEASRIDLTWFPPTFVSDAEKQSQCEFFERDNKNECRWFNVNINNFHVFSTCSCGAAHAMVLADKIMEDF